MEVISGPRRLLGMWPCSHGFAAVSHILGFEMAQRGSLCSLDRPVMILHFSGRCLWNATSVGLDVKSRKRIGPVSNL